MEAMKFPIHLLLILLILYKNWDNKFLVERALNLRENYCSVKKKGKIVQKRNGTEV